MGGGHSMGGYLSVAYCERYPQHVDKLILISPVGVPAKEKQNRDIPLGYRLVLNTFRLAWDAGFTPGSVLRMLSEERGRRLVYGYINGRLPSISCEEEKETLTDYLYTNAMLPGS